MELYYHNSGDNELQYRNLFSLCDKVVMNNEALKLIKCTVTCPLGHDWNFLFNDEYGPSMDYAGKVFKACDGYNSIVVELVNEADKEILFAAPMSDLRELVEYWIELFAGCIPQQEVPELPAEEELSDDSSKKIIQLLDLLSKEAKDCDEQTHLSVIFQNDTSEYIIEEISGLACELFISTDGSVNRTNMYAFNDTHSGRFKIGPGETDSFGWLTGVIYTPVGKIVYG